ncbi:MAG: hypothetical protein Q8N91_06165, partial [Candidatus Omnitrophota bacterium]|nr:hypothetical protein [Candidatus Omnitrophota bacterium]
RKDGIVISGITYDEETITGYKIALPEGMGGSKVIIKDSYIYSEEKSDGSVTTRYPNGWIKSVKDARGEEADYVYEVPLTLDGNENGKTYYARISTGTLSLDEGAMEGTFTIDPVEVNAKELRHIDWRADLLLEAGAAIQIRTTESLNSGDIDASPWSSWSSEITSPQDLTGITGDKYLQYKVILRRPSGTDSPSVNLESIKIELLARLSDGNDEGLTHVVEKDGKRYVYDGIEQLVKIIDGTTTYTYTPEGKIKSIIESGGRTAAYIYNDKDRAKLTGITTKNNGEELHYDSSLRLTKVIRSSTGMQYEYFYNDDIVTVKTTYTSKQGAKEDFADFRKDGIAINDYDGLTRILLERQVPLDYGTGADGVLTVKKGQTRTLEARTYNFESIYVEEGAVLTVEPWNGATGGRLVIKSQKEAVIDGTVQVDAKGYRQEEGPGAGGRGQDGQDIDNQNNRMRGAGGGGAGHAAPGGVGVGYGTSPGAAGQPYSNPEISASMMGSGGGRGGIYNAANYQGAGAGGSGGGIIQIISPIININGMVSANGQDGENAPGALGGSGGGGSGGSIIINGENVSIVGNVLSKGGYRGVSNQYAGDGAPGRIRVDYGVKEGDILQKDQTYWNQLTYVTEGALTSSAIALNINDVDTATGYLNANLDIPVLSNVKIETRAGAAGNVNNDADWSGWQEATLDQYGYKINSRLNNFIQYRIVLTSKESDKSPSIYALNDFAVKLSFTNIEHKNSADAAYEAAKVLTPAALPVILNTARDRIEKVTAGGVVQDVSTLTSSNLIYSPDDISSFSKQIYSSALDNNEPLTTKFNLDATGNMKAEYVQKKDGSIEHYDSDGKVRFVTDANGQLLVRYYYDEGGNLKDVRLWAERNNLSHQITLAQNEIIRHETEDLQRLADEVGANHAQLDTQVTEVQAELDEARAEVESYRYITYQTQASSAFGSKIVTVSVENPYYAGMIAKLDLAEQKFRDNTELAYFSLDNMENVSRGRIEAAATAAFSNLKRQQEVSMVQILRKELTTVIYDYYIKYLGRLPGTKELNDLIENLAQKSALLQ